MQMNNKKFLPINYSQEYKIEIYKEMRNHMQDVLITLIKDKQVWQKQQKVQKQLLNQQILQKQKSIEALLQQNEQLKEQVQMLKKQLASKINDISSLRREKQLVERKNISNNNIITYLQAKNKQISYELYQANKIISLKRKEGNISKEIKLKSQNNNLHQSEYVFNRIEYPSMFDYTGVMDQDISIEIPLKNQSIPNIEAITATSSSVPIIVRNYSSDVLQQLNQKEQKQQYYKLKTDLDECQLLLRKETLLTKGSIKKINTLNNLFSLDSKKNLKESRKVKKLTIDQDIQSLQKKKIETKSRLSSKKIMNSKKFK